MAHAARISELTDGLIRSVAGDRSQHASYLRMRDQASKTFRNTTHARTNQFEIQSKVTGLVEKFAVLNRDDLADALQARLDDLPRESKWMPEILSLLLQLSDRPLEKTKIEDVEALSKREDKQPGLTWDDIIAEDPLDETGVWDNIERGYHSSGDDATVDGDAGSDDSNVTQATSVEDDTIALARLHIVQPEEQLLDDFQAVVGASSRRSELILIRETLSILHGLPTNVYQIHELTGEFSVRRATNLETATGSTITDLLCQLAETGTALNLVRRWAMKPEDTPYLQSCQAAVLSTLTTFNSQMSAIEQRYAAPIKDTVVSLIDLRSEVEIAARPLLRLSQILMMAETTANPSHFALFDALYDDICVNEISGNNGVVNILAHVFLSGLKTYLKPLSLWIQAGTLDRNDKTSMIIDADPECEYGRLWRDRFTLRTLTDGRVYAPTFMHHLAQKIFAIGKTRAFLQALGDCEDVAGDTQKNATRAVDSLVDRLGTTQLLPFSELLEDSLESWIEDTSRDSTPILHQKLLHDHGLLRAVDRLEEVFCSKNGIHFQVFAETLFWRIDHQPNAWNNQFVLSELAQSTLGNETDLESLTVRVLDSEDSTQTQSSIKNIGTLALETSFSWQVQNITCSRTSITHARTFAFLLQTYRARFQLRAHILDLRQFGSRACNSTFAARLALRLRQRLIAFIDILHTYIANISYALHGSLKKELIAATDIDDMAAAWRTHIKQMDTALLLASKFSAIREAITACLELCEQFAPLWVRLVDTDVLARGTNEDGVKPHEREKTLQTPPPAESDFVSMRVELDKSLSFVLAGVRSIGRASGNKMLEELAERLEWIVQ